MRVSVVTVATAQLMLPVKPSPARLTAVGVPPVHVTPFHDALQAVPVHVASCVPEPVSDWPQLMSDDARRPLLGGGGGGGDGGDGGGDCAPQHTHAASSSSATRPCRVPACTRPPRAPRLSTRLRCTVAAQQSGRRGAPRERRIGHAAAARGAGAGRASCSQVQARAGTTTSGAQQQRPRELHNKCAKGPKRQTSCQHGAGVRRFLRRTPAPDVAVARQHSAAVSTRAHNQRKAHARALLSFRAASGRCSSNPPRCDRRPHSARLHSVARLAQQRTEWRATKTAAGLRVRSSCATVSSRQGPARGARVLMWPTRPVQAARHARRR
jgi:hypothetical protein